MKIAYQIPKFSQGGVPTTILEFVKHNKNSQLKIYIIGTKGEELLINDFIKFDSELIFIKLNKVSLLSLLKLLFVLLKIKPDVFHTAGRSGLFYGLFSVPIIKLFFHFKVFHTFHGFVKSKNKISSFIHILFENIYSFFLESAICVSNSEHAMVKKIYLKKHKLKIINNGINVIKNSPPKDILLCSQNFHLNIVTFSRISKQKNLIKLLNVFNSVFCIHPNSALHIIGGEVDSDLEYSKLVKNHTLQLPCSKNVFFWGPVNQASSFLNLFSLYVSSSDFEGLPTAIIEAFIQKVPVAATPCVGNIDLVTENTGYLASDMSEKALLNSILTAIKEINSGLGHNKINFAYNYSIDFSVSSFSTKLLRLYNEK